MEFADLQSAIRKRMACHWNWSPKGRISIKREKAQTSVCQFLNEISWLNWLYNAVIHLVDIGLREQFLVAAGGSIIKRFTDSCNSIEFRPHYIGLLFV